MTQPHKDEGTVWVTIDGRRIEVARGSFVLAATRRLGIEVPTLCDHPDLEPVGSCRLCMVEVGHPDWKGWKGLVTSCLYPVQEGLEVSTRSDAVVAARRGVLALLAARCPGSATIGALAERHGATTEGLRSSVDADDCILCGSCTRVCEAFATSAIATVGRGTDKRISSFAHASPADCVGCGACAIVCPTGEIKGVRDAQGYRIWDRTFPTAVCTVDSERCIACGSCAEACPFAVARVALGRGGVARAVIPAEHCRGCGACVGACPTGAIEQQGFALAKVLRSTPPAVQEPLTRVAATTVIACRRAGLGAAPTPVPGRGSERTEAGLSGERRVVELPCTGRVSVPMLLAELAAGADALLVLGRNERTCRLGGAEASARRSVDRSRQLLALLGQDPARIHFEQPASGPSGPVDAARAFASRGAAMGPLRRPRGAPPALHREDLDGALEQLRWLHACSAAATAPPLALGVTNDALAGWCRLHGLAVAEADGPGLCIGELAWLELLVGDRLPLRPPLGLVRVAIEVMRRLGETGAGIALAPSEEVSALRLGLGACGMGSALTRGPVDAARAPRPLDEWLCDRADAIARPATPGRVATDGSAQAARLVVALGHEPLDVGEDPLPDRFSFSNAQQASAVRRLERAQQGGAEALLVADPRSWLRLALLVRTGSWRASTVVPVLGVELAWGGLHGRAARWRSVEAPLRRPGADVAMEVLV